ncbi:hypothetical protein J6590_052461 [Homalodisca vitripennis]|nr:hypothetical protein J6590_052461 [Homalodisca vitripennis]
MAFTRRSVIERKKRLDSDLSSLTENLDSGVVDHAVELRAALSLCKDRYGEDSIIQLLPVCIAVLDYMNHLSQKNKELEVTNDSLSNENEDIQSCLAKEKLLRKQVQDECFNMENESLNSVNDHKKIVTDLEKELKLVKEKLKTHQEITLHLNDNINILNLEVETLRNINEKLMLDISQLQEKSEETPNNTYRNYVPDRLPISNRFASISLADKTPVFEENQTPSLPVSSTRKTHRQPRRHGKKKFSQSMAASIHSDSHGRHMSRILAREFGQKTCLVKPGLVRPGAPLEEVVKGAKMDSNGLKDNEFLIVIGGTNSVDKYDDISIIQAYNDLLASANNLKVIVSTIPPRFDLSPLAKANEFIRKVNAEIRKLLFRFTNVKILDLGVKTMSSFDKRGIHFHMKGKAKICKEIKNLIVKWNENVSISDVLPTHDSHTPNCSPQPSGLRATSPTQKELLPEPKPLNPLPCCSSAPSPKLCTLSNNGFLD